MKIKIEENKKEQTIYGFGASACWWSQYAGKSENMEQVVDYLYSKDGLGLNIYRYNIGAGEAENPNSRIPLDWRRAESFYFYNETTDKYEYDFSRDAAAQEVLKTALSKGCVDTVILFANSPHYSITTSGQASGGLEANQSNLPKGNYQAYVDYFLDITEYFLSQGVPIKYISPINEPQWKWGGESVSQEGCHYEKEEVIELLGMFAREIEKRGLNVKISGPESGEIGDTTNSYFDLMSQDETLMKYLATYSYHSYWADEDSIKKLKFGNWLKDNYSDKIVEMSEWCELPCKSPTDDIKGALITAKVISQDITLTGVNSWSAWVGVNEIGINETDGKNYSDGLLYATNDFSDYCVAMRYYGLAHFSKFIPSGSQRLELNKNMSDLRMSATTNDDNGDLIVKSDYEVNVSAFKTPHGNIVLVIVNAGKARDFEINVSKANMNVYQTTEDYQLKELQNGEYNSKINITGESITTIIYS